MLDEVEAVPGQLLYAVFGSATEGHFDLENVLFYNVGTKFLNRAGRYGVRFERRFAAPPLPENKLAPMPHYHCYALTSTNGQFKHWQNGAQVAHWTFSAERAADLRDCARVWLALKQNGKVTVGTDTLAGPLQLRISIAIPQGSGLAAMTFLKPLLDGIISAFHAHDGDDEMEIARRLARRTGANAEVITDLLRQRKSAVLGTRRLLWKWGMNGVQWNPADERCVAVEVQLNELQDLKTFAVRGEMRMAISGLTEAGDSMQVNRQNSQG